MDNLEFLDGAEAPIAETQPQETAPEQQEAQAEAAPQQEETPAQTEARERDEKGRFKPKPEPVMVPLQALHETRDEVKALKAQIEALQPHQQPQAEQVPDIFENPEGYAAYLQNQVAATALNDRLNLSEELVRQSAGDEAVAAAQEWGRQMLASNPGFAQAFYQQRNPYGFLVQQHQRYQAVSQLGDDPKELQAFLAWKQGQAQQPGAQPIPQSSPVPTGSIASATSAGGVGHVAIGPGVAFGDTIK